MFYFFCPPGGDAAEKRPRPQSGKPAREGTITMTIRTKLWTMALAVALLISAMAGVGYVKSRSAMESQLNAVGIETAATVTHGGALYFERLEMALANIREGVLQLREAGFGRTAEELQPHMARYTEGNKAFGVKDVFFAFEGLKGAESFSDGTGWVPADDYDPTVRSWYRQAADSGKMIISDPYQDGITGRMVVSLAAPFKEKGKLVGVIGLDVETTALNAFIVNQKILGKGFGLLVDGSGNVIAAPDEEWIMKENIARISSVVTDEMERLGRRMLAGESGFGDYRSPLDNREKRLFFAPTGKGLFLALEYPVAEIRAAVEALARTQALLGASALIIALALIIVISRGIQKSLARLLETTDRISGGDLTARYEGRDRDELDRIGTALNGMVAGLRKLVENADGAARDTLDRAESLAAFSEETVASMEEIRGSMDQMAGQFQANAADLEETNAGVEEIASASHTTAQAASEGAEGAARTREMTESAVEEVTGVITDIVNVETVSADNVAKAALLEEAVRQITGFVSSITSIADQTNLLALNAAIEAARAGEHGRGFAVVAEEVRKLAEESGQAAKEINALIVTLREHSSGSVAASRRATEILEETARRARKAREGLKRSADEIAGTLDAMQNLAAVAEEQAASSGEMATAVDAVARGTATMAETVQTVRKATEETSGASESIAREAQILSETARELQSLLGHFRLEGDGPSGLIPIEKRS